MSLGDLDYCVTETIGGGDEGGLISKDHPGFNDLEYIRRREEIAKIGTCCDYGWGREKYSLY